MQRALRHSCGRPGGAAGVAAAALKNLIRVSVRLCSWGFAPKLNSSSPQHCPRNRPCPPLDIAAGGAAQCTVAAGRASWHGEKKPCACACACSCACVCVSEGEREMGERNASSSSPCFFCLLQNPLLCLLFAVSFSLSPSHACRRRPVAVRVRRRARVGHFASRHGRP